MSKITKPSMRGKGYSVSADRSLLLNEVQFALDYVNVKGGWVILVTPTSDLTTLVSKFVHGGSPEGSISSGRTTILPGKGRISVAQVNQPFTIPEDKEVVVQFVGWSEANESQFNDMGQWRARATHVIDLLHTNDSAHA